MIIRPIGKRILIHPQKFEQEKVSSSGIVYGTENTNTTQTSKAVIVSVGDEVTKVTKGQKIYYESFAGHMVNIEGKDFTIIEEINVLGVIHE